MIFKHQAQAALVHCTKCVLLIIKTGQKVEERFKGDENLETIHLTYRVVSFSYVDGDEYIFMDNEDFTPYNFTKTYIEELLFFSATGSASLQVLVMDNQAIALELPQTVDMVIVETALSIKRASANARTKPAKMATRLIIQVPEYLSVGEKIRIHIAERHYMVCCD